MTCNIVSCSVQGHRKNLQAAGGCPAEFNVQVLAKGVLIVGFTARAISKHRKISNHHKPANILFFTTAYLLYFTVPYKYIPIFIVTYLVVVHHTTYS